jgi:hypothetical protein
MVTTEYLEGPISSVALTAHIKYTGLTVKEPLVQPHRNEFHGIPESHYSRILRKFGRCLDLRAS